MDAIKNKQKYGAKQSGNQFFVHDRDFGNHRGDFLPVAAKIFGLAAPVMVIAGLILVILLIGLRVIDQYERGIVLTLGQYFGHSRTGAYLDSAGHPADDQGGYAHHHGGHSVAGGDHQRQCAGGHQRGGLFSSGVGGKIDIEH